MIEHLTHIYAEGSPFEYQAVRDVSLCVPDGAFLGLIGHTGSGKSTLIQHMNGLLPPTSGRVIVDGQDVWQKGVSRKQIRFAVGLVFQYPEYQLFEETVAKDVAFGPRNLGLSEAESMQRAQEACERVRLSWPEVAERSPFELSGGQRRRVAMAGVLAMRPRYLILDEPAAGLDPAGRERMLELLQHLHTQGGVTIVMVSHSMDDVARFASRIAVMEHGRLVLEGPPEEVFAHADRLEAMGLGVPTPMLICRALQKRGLPVPLCTRVEDAADAIAAALAAREGAEPSR